MGIGSVIFSTEAVGAGAAQGQWTADGHRECHFFDRGRGRRGRARTVDTIWTLSAGEPDAISPRTLGVSGALADMDIVGRRARRHKPPHARRVGGFSRYGHCRPASRVTWRSSSPVGNRSVGEVAAPSGLRVTWRSSSPVGNRSVGEVAAPSGLRVTWRSSSPRPRSRSSPANVGDNPPQPTPQPPHRPRSRSSPANVGDNPPQPTPQPPHRPRSRSSPAPGQAANAHWTPETSGDRDRKHWTARPSG